MTTNTHQTIKQTQANNSYNNTIKILNSQGKFYINLGLERIGKLLNIIGNPQDELKCIQVAGTNGKGSVCSILNSILTEYGYKTGLYTSPHIFEYTERIKINDRIISKEDFCQYFTKILETADKNDIHLTEFEILTAMMFKYFKDNKIDIAIIETGLGGRLDATNIIKNNICSVITHIDLDHTDRLGNTKEQIAFEKAGIIKENSKIITNENFDIINKISKDKNSDIIKGDKKNAKKLSKYLNLRGRNQTENLSLALSVTTNVFKDINEEIIINSLKKVNHPCRFEFIKEKNLIIDGAHNPNCFKELRKNLDYYYPDIPKQYIFGCLNTKDYASMLKYITADKNLHKLCFYQFSNVNSCDYNTLQKKCKIKALELKDKSEIEYSDKILTVICGSFYMLKELVS